MSFLEILDTLLLRPLYLLFEIIYVMANKVIDNPGLSIIVLSLFMNFLVLPLYMRADKIQEEEHALEKKLRRGVEHIKKTFSGDERMMMLQTYYRQNNYKPVYVLRSAVSLFLQIPFFIAAYRFLSGLQLLNGVSFGPIADLGRPDGMLQLGGISVNLLPVIMTAVNLASCVIFTKGSPLKAKLQLYIMALFFLVFLYSSPAGLVFYWTLNNVFSLVKTIFYKLKNPGKVLSVICSVGGILLAVFSLLLYRTLMLKKAAFLLGIAVCLELPLLYSIAKGRIKWKGTQNAASKKVFFSGGIFLAVLTGALIPSAVIEAAPLDFVEITDFYNPLWFVVSSFCLAFGVFVVWAGVFYFLAKVSIRVHFDSIVWIFSVAATINYMFFGKNLGLISSQLKYEKELDFVWSEQICNVVIMLVAMLTAWIIYKYWKKLTVEVLTVGALALLGMTVVNIKDINYAVKDIKVNKNIEEINNFQLSRTGKNVIVLMLDRAIGAYIPYFLDEKPELKEQFSGFTYYANVVSFGGQTTYGAPAIFGGYEYTPAEINKRDDETLVSKHDEALKVMPVLFYENNCETTVCNPPYAGYSWIGDVSIYEEYPGIRSFNIGGEFTDTLIKEQWIRNNKRDFFCYSVCKTVPLCIQHVLYDQGRYNKAEETGVNYSKFIMDGPYKSIGMDPSFMQNYNILSNLPDMTVTVDKEINTFLMMSNDITHCPMLLQEPDYIPALQVDNTEFEKEIRERVNADGRKLNMETGNQTSHYHANMAAMIQLGKWFDYMRENGVYDNTRIILVSDHGFPLDYWDEFKVDGNDDIAHYYPLLMVKDFYEKGFTVSEEFMTNGDVPSFTMGDIIENPINPFTGRIIDDHEKSAHDQYIISSHGQGESEYSGNTFYPTKWYAVHDDMRDSDNWKVIAEDAVLPVD